MHMQTLLFLDVQAGLAVPWGNVLSLMLYNGIGNIIFSVRNHLTLSLSIIRQSEASSRTKSKTFGFSTICHTKGRRNVANKTETT